MIFMPTSVTIPDELRRKIKKLAAIFDTSQAEIIKIAISEYEQKFVLKEDFSNPKLIDYLNKISKEVFEQNPDRKIRFQKLTAPGISIDSISPAKWGRSVDE